MSVGLELWAAFQPTGWIYADSLTLTFQMLSFLVSTVEFSKSAKVYNSLFDVYRAAKVGKPKGPLPSDMCTLEKPGNL